MPSEATDREISARSFNCAPGKAPASSLAIHVRLFAKVRDKRTPLRLVSGDSIFAAIYCKRSHLAPGRWVARSRRDLPLSPLERLQLRVLATRISAVPPHFPRLSPWTRVVRSATGHASSTIEPVSHRDTTWEKHPLAPAFLVLSIHKINMWLVENRTIYQLEK